MTFRRPGAQKSRVWLAACYVSWLGCLAGLLDGSVAAAQNPDVSSAAITPSAASPGPREQVEPREVSESSEQVVLLTGGNIIRGSVNLQSNYVLVEQGGVAVRLPQHRVQKVGANESELYHWLAGRVADDPVARCQLIRWCLRHGLREPALQQVRVLERDYPGLPELPVLKRQAEYFRSAAEQTILMPKRPAHRDEQFADEVTDQLSTRSIANFTREIQPLLLNRCGQAGCHGSATETDYRLTAALLSRPSQRVTMRNLGATLRRIEQSEAGHTLLFLSAAAPHAKMDTAPLRAREQSRLLDWIRQALIDQTGRPAVSEPVAGTIFSRSDSLAGPANPSRAGDSSNSVNSGNKDAKGTKGRGDDPFDPAGFNARRSTSPSDGGEKEWEEIEFSRLR